MGDLDSGLVPAEHERDLAATLRALFADLLPSAALREAVESPDGFDAGSWSALAKDVGLCGLTVPESFGGLGLGLREANTVHTELGRALYPGPFLGTSLATTAILSGGDGRSAERWLPRLAAGDLCATVALVEADCSAAPTVGGWRLSGVAAFVPYGHVADLILVQAGGSVFAVPHPAAGVTVRQLPGLDLTRRLSNVELTEAPGELLGAAGQGGAVWEAVGSHARIALAAEAVGGLDWCLATCVEHARTRQQFGRPIGSFQAVAHACVDLLAARQRAGAAARWAADAAARDAAEAQLAGQVAALRAGLAYREQTEAAIHILGGTGFTWEHDAHLYYRRARSALALTGGAAAQREAIATAAGLS